MNLVKKSILYVQDDSISIDFFALSFRNYILSKKNSDEIEILLKEYSAPGTWDSMKIPMFSIVGAVAVFLIVTQGDFTQKLTGIITSIAALLPLVFRLFDKKATA